MLDLSIPVSNAVCSLKDDILSEAQAIEEWMNQLTEQDEKEAKIMKSLCEICNSNTKLELHHIAGRKHDYRTITVCRICHDELSDTQNQWDGRWWKPDQPERIREAFFLMGLRDILLLKAKKTYNTIYKSLAMKLGIEISKRLRA